MTDGVNRLGLRCAEPGKSTVPAPPCNLLLVSASKSWTQAVQDAAAELGGGVSRCDAKGAVIRLAGMAPHYSHLLLHPDSADGLLERAGQPHRGRPGLEHRDAAARHGRDPRPRIGIIRSADRGAVRQALAPHPAHALESDNDPMHLTELREALDGAMIETRYQPIVRLADRQPVALEALARLNHPTRGTLPPGEFVPQIEACRPRGAPDRPRCRSRPGRHGGTLLAAHRLDITLNFPLDVLLVPDALRRLDTGRRAAGVAAEQVVIELTESRSVEDLAALRGVLERLRADGYRVSIDDVSPAVPHVAELLELPFNGLKLDKAVVQHACRKSRRCRPSCSASWTWRGRGTCPSWPRASRTSPPGGACWRLAWTCARASWSRAPAGCRGADLAGGMAEPARIRVTASQRGAVLLAALAALTASASSWPGSRRWRRTRRITGFSPALWRQDTWTIRRWWRCGSAPAPRLRGRGRWACDCSGRWRARSGRFCCSTPRNGFGFRASSLPLPLWAWTAKRTKVGGTGQFHVPHRFAPPTLG